MKKYIEKIQKSQVAFLKITTFGVKHWYGKLIFPYPSYSTEEVFHPLSKEEASYLNYHDDWMEDTWRHKEGELSSRFETISELIKSSAETLEKSYPNIKILLKDDYNTNAFCPSELLWTKNPDYKELQDIWMIYDKAVDIADYKASVEFAEKASEIWRRFFDVENV